MWRVASRMVPRLGQAGRERVLRFMILVGLGLALGACSKCDIPTWPRSAAEMIPQSCHSDPPL